MTAFSKDQRNVEEVKYKIALMQHFLKIYLYTCKLAYGGFRQTGVIFFALSTAEQKWSLYFYPRFCFSKPWCLLVCYAIYSHIFKLLCSSSLNRNYVNGSQKPFLLPCLSVISKNSLPSHRLQLLNPIPYFFISINRMLQRFVRFFFLCCWFFFDSSELLQIMFIVFCIYNDLI